MKCIIVEQAGEGGGQLKLQYMPEPQASDHDIIVKVQAAGINRIDLLQRYKKGFSGHLGVEVAGEIVDVGKDVTALAVGQRVVGRVSGGGYAQYCLMHQAMAMPIPDVLSYEQAAALPIAGITANESLFECGNLQTNQTILIHSGGSGVGVTAIQMALHRGANVITTVGNEEKCAKAKALGANAVICYPTSDIVDNVNQVTDNQGVDIIIDFYGDHYTNRNLTLLKPNGKLIQLAKVFDAMATVDLGLIIRNRLTIKGWSGGPQSLDDKIAMTKRFANTWLPAYARQHIAPVIDCVFSLDDATKAHTYMKSNTHFGKLILTP